MKRKLICAMHCTPHERKKVINRGNKVGNGLTDNASVFTAPTPHSAADILSETDILQKLDAKTDHGSAEDTSKANEQSFLVYNMLHDEMPYCDKVANGVESVIRMSGYEPTEEPHQKDIPGQPVIKKIVDWKEEHSAKIIMEKIEPGAMHIVEIRRMDEPDFKLAVQTTNSYHLILRNLERAKEIEVRVKDQNTKGVGKPSNSIIFLPR